MNHLYAKMKDRVDFSVIAGWIEPESRVLDLGCGSGSLLEYLFWEKKVSGMGVDIDQEKIIKCVARSIPVIQQDLNQGLNNFGDKSYDYIILSQTLQVLHHPLHLIEDMLRVGKYAIVSFPNFAHCRVRLNLLFGGRMPKSKSLPFEWYDTPNIHNLTIKDFRDFCRQKRITVLKEVHIRGRRSIRRGFMPNLFSEAAVALITR